MAQIAAAQLGVSVDKVKVVAGDTSTVSLGLGGFASRQTVTAGSSVHLAAKQVAEKAKSSGRIDGMVALAMAAKGATATTAHRRPSQRGVFALCEFGDHVQPPQRFA